MIDKPGNSVGKILYLLRVVSFETLEEVAEETGYNKSHLSELENGKKHLSMESLVKLAHYHRMKPWALLKLADRLTEPGINARKALIEGLTKRD